MEVSYKLSGTLPTGLNLDENTGKISGTPLESGKFNVVVQMIADGWITKTATVTLEIKPTLSVSVVTNEPSLGKVFEATVANNIEGFTVVDEKTISAAGTYYTAATYAAEGLPEGLAIDEATGAISGTPLESGTFKATVKLNYTLATASMGWGNRLNIRKTNGSYTSEVTITIASNSENPGEEKPSVSYEDFKGMQGKLDSLENSLKGLQDKLDSLKDDISAGNGNEKSGCNASVTGAGALAVVIPTLIAACFVAIKSRKKEVK